MPRKGIPPTVCNFQLALTSKLTQYDAAASARERRPNVYRLGHLLTAAQKVEDDVKRAAPDCNVTMTPAIADVMRRSISTRFEPGFPPAKKIAKQIDDFISTGRNPTLLGARRRGRRGRR